MPDLTFILGLGIVGSHFIPDGIQALAGQEIEPQGIVYRKMDPRKALLITVSGKDGREAHVPISCFSQHPPEWEIRRNNSLKGII